MKIVRTEDGSHTILVPEIDEHYHSVHGAIQESEHIFIKSGLEYCQADPVHILEIGFGTGLNALLTATSTRESGKKVYYTSIEKYPLDQDIISLLNYPEMIGKESQKLFYRLHSARWDVEEEIFPGFILKKIKADLLFLKIKGFYDLIFYDAFSPEKQPEMWSAELLSMISDVTVNGGILVTYCARGEIRRFLMNSGFTTDLLPGPPGKRHIMRAVKNKKSDI